MGRNIAFTVKQADPGPAFRRKERGLRVPVCIAGIILTAGNIAAKDIFQGKSAFRQDNGLFFQRTDKASAGERDQYLRIRRRS